jgi:hypothetical protein
MQVIHPHSEPSRDSLQIEPRQFERREFQRGHSNRPHFRGVERKLHDAGLRTPNLTATKVDRCTSRRYITRRVTPFTHFRPAHGIVRAGTGSSSADAARSAAIDGKRDYAEAHYQSRDAADLDESRYAPRRPTRARCPARRSDTASAARAPSRPRPTTEQ